MKVWYEAAFEATVEGGLVDRHSMSGRFIDRVVSDGALEMDFENQAPGGATAG